MLSISAVKSISVGVATIFSAGGSWADAVIVLTPVFID